MGRSEGLPLSYRLFGWVVGCMPQMGHICVVGQGGLVGRAQCLLHHLVTVEQDTNLRTDRRPIVAEQLQSVADPNSNVAVSNGKLMLTVEAAQSFVEVKDWGSDR